MNTHPSAEDVFPLLCQTDGGDQADAMAPVRPLKNDDKLPVLEVVDALGLRMRHNVTSQGLLIGRSAVADIRLRDRFAAGRHVEIWHENGAVMARDMGSPNGLWLRVLETAVVPRSGELNLGNTLIRVLNGE
jgi:hypothetical protein